jgi:hypothetical protein
VSTILITHIGKKTNFFFNALILLISFNSGLGKYEDGCRAIRRLGFIKSMLLEGQEAPPPW